MKSLLTRKEASASHWCDSLEAKRLSISAPGPIRPIWLRCSRPGKKPGKKSQSGLFLAELCYDAPGEEHDGFPTSQVRNVRKERFEEPNHPPPMGHVSPASSVGARRLRGRLLGSACPDGQARGDQDPAYLSLK